MDPIEELKALVEENQRLRRENAEMLDHVARIETAMEHLDASLARLAQTVQELKHEFQIE